MDFPGHGFSDKPQGWGYSLARDAELIEHYLSEVLGAESAVVVGHDRGDSVALIHAARCAEGRSAVRLEHLVLSNANIFLPMSNLTEVQRRILDPSTGPEMLAALTPEQMAEAMGASTFTPPRKAGDPEVEALAVTFAHADGVKVLHETIQYLMFQPGGNRLYFIPDANHYLQVRTGRTRLRKSSCTRSNPLAARHPAPSRRDWALPCRSIPLCERLPAAADVLRA